MLGVTGSWRPAVQLSGIQWVEQNWHPGLFGDLLKGRQMIVWAEGGGRGSKVAASRPQEEWPKDLRRGVLTVTVTGQPQARTPSLMHFGALAGCLDSLLSRAKPSP